MNKRGILVTISRESTEVDYPYVISPGVTLLDSVNQMIEKGFNTYFNQDDPLLDKWLHWADDENYSGDLSEIENLYPLYFVNVNKDEIEQYMSNNNITQTIEHVDESFDISNFVKVPQ